jgi:hypothetical protein
VAANGEADTEVRKAIEAGVADGIKVMRETVRGQVVNGWHRHGTLWHQVVRYWFFGRRTRQQV